MIHISVIPKKNKKQKKQENKYVLLNLCFVVYNNYYVTVFAKLILRRSGKWLYII